MNVLQSLKSLSGYPIPSTTIQDVAEGFGLDVSAEMTDALRKSRDFKRAQAHIYYFLSEAPSVSQGGISYSFSDEDRERFREKAESMLDKVSDDDRPTGVTYGYQGGDL